MALCLTERIIVMNDIRIRLTRECASDLLEGKADYIITRSPFRRATDKLEATMIANEITFSNKEIIFARDGKQLATIQLPQNTNLSRGDTVTVMLKKVSIDFSLEQ
jgi:hypothetical protein